ncbi:MAG: biotin carboxylase N-terminal domain-containing protein, partial [Alphaproteobacteria bacterium]|nr:biotin carboxylase N-terminal domain-containing protein [Alphaproteobacteria bacterium]
NRGEIACRIIDTLHRLGIASVAVYHQSERRSRFVQMADEAIEIYGETPVAAYLDGAQIIQAAQTSGAEAIHPGYGFLSENSGFARQVKKAGLTFIGPTPDAIELMGDKIRSREFAREHNIPIAPSVKAGDDLDTFVEAASEIGFPLLIKASAGGGGKGMSIVRTRETLASLAKTAMNEAQRYFANSAIYAERYIERPRHIEVQVFGDGAGGAVHLFERECSIQRRFQKIVEEAPAANLPPALREQICDAAVRLAKAAKYLNAGTVEFILAPDNTFYFLEMNTRLQVEHPVTEMVTGLDLVQMQIEIAAGRPFPMRQEAITVAGHAIECRICAEVPERDFMPATGRILQFNPPIGDAIRFENGLLEGQDVTLNFDSMLAKLVVHGSDREAATTAMNKSLSETILLGVETNINYLARVIGHPAFAEALLHTDFVIEHKAALDEPEHDAATVAKVLLAAALTFREFRTLAFEAPDPYAAMGAWRN